MDIKGPDIRGPNTNIKGPDTVGPDTNFITEENVMTISSAVPQQQDILVPSLVTSGKKRKPKRSLTWGSPLEWEREKPKIIKSNIDFQVEFHEKQETENTSTTNQRMDKYTSNSTESPEFDNQAYVNACIISGMENHEIQNFNNIWGKGMWLPPLDENDDYGNEPPKFEEFNVGQSVKIYSAHSHFPDKRNIEKITDAQLPDLQTHQTTDVSPRIDIGKRPEVFTLALAQHHV